MAINTAIAEGDIETALEILNTELIHLGYDPIVLPVDADTPTAESGDRRGRSRLADGSKATMTDRRRQVGGGHEDRRSQGEGRTRSTGEIKVDADTGLAAAALLTFLSIPRTTEDLRRHRRGAGRQRGDQHRRP